MKKTKTRYNPDMILFDTSIKYLIPMLPIEVGIHRTFDNEKPIEIQIVQLKDGYVKASAEGYQDKYFMDKYFEWLLYTGYVRKVDDKK